MSPWLHVVNLNCPLAVKQSICISWLLHLFIDHLFFHLPHAHLSSLAWTHLKSGNYCFALLLKSESAIQLDLKSQNILQFRYFSWFLVVIFFFCCNLYLGVTRALLTTEIRESLHFTLIAICKKSKRLLIKRYSHIPHFLFIIKVNVLFSPENTLFISNTLVYLKSILIKMIFLIKINLRFHIVWILLIFYHVTAVSSLKFIIIIMSCW